MAAESGHCLFVSKPTGYELVDREGEPPSVGSVVELDGQGQLGREPDRAVPAPAGPPAVRLPPAHD